MTPEQKARILKKAEEHGSKNINIGEYPLLINHDPWANDSLAKVINTKEKAEIFMLLLEREINKANNK